MKNLTESQSHLWRILLRSVQQIKSHLSECMSVQWRPFLYIYFFQAWLAALKGKFAQKYYSLCPKNTPQVCPIPFPNDKMWAKARWVGFFVKILVISSVHISHFLVRHFCLACDFSCLCNLGWKMWKIRWKNVFCDTIVDASAAMCSARVALTWALLSVGGGFDIKQPFLLIHTQKDE